MIQPPSPPPSERVTRFAPSPTGYLHFGHVVHALYVWAVAAKRNAQVLLRIEDHDRVRCKPEYETALLQDLEWLGLTPHHPPISGFRSGPSEFRQSDCAAVYEDALQQLQGVAHVYACDCSRRTLQERTGASGEEIPYDGFCRHRKLPFAKGNSIRVELPAGEIFFFDLMQGPCIQSPATQCGDMMLRDNLGQWTYQFCVVVDDLRQGVNLIVRGMDILQSTGRQLQLAKMLGRTSPPVFLHHPLLLDATGRKLSKRDFDADIHSLFLSGTSARSVWGQAAKLAGWISDDREISLQQALGLAQRSIWGLGEALRNKKSPN